MEFCAGAGERGDHTDQDGRPTYQFYHLGADSGEQWNLYGTCPDVEEALLSEMERCVRQGRSTPGAPQPTPPVPSGRDWAFCGRMTAMTPASRKIPIRSEP